MNAEAFDEDPEVLDDLRKREASERDPTRTRSAVGASGAAWSKPVAIGKWKCRNPVCKALVDVTEFTMDLWATCNEWLRMRGDPPLDRNSILVCEVCELEVRRFRADAVRRKVDELAAVIRALRESNNPRGERDLIAQLVKLHHPDIPGLLDAIGSKPRRSEKRL